MLPHQKSPTSTLKQSSHIPPLFPLHPTLFFFLTFSVFTFIFSLYNWSPPARWNRDFVLVCCTVSWAWKIWHSITLPTKVHLVKAMVFPVVMYGCESWTVKKAERRRINAFKLWCWRRLLKVPWTARRSNQSILSPGCSLEGLMLKLKLQYFDHLMQRVDSLKKTWCWGGLGAGGEDNDRGWDGWMASLTRWIWVWVNSGSWWWTGRPGVLRFMGSQSRTQLSNWTEMKLQLNLLNKSLSGFKNSTYNCVQV